jgi:hypothetical protein
VGMSSHRRSMKEGCTPNCNIDTSSKMQFYELPAQSVQPFFSRGQFHSPQGKSSQPGRPSLLPSSSSRVLSVQLVSPQGPVSQSVVLKVQSVLSRFSQSVLKVQSVSPLKVQSVLKVQSAGSKQEQENTIVNTHNNTQYSIQ